MASGTISLDSSKAWEGQIYWSSEINIAGNYSDVYIRATMWKTDGHLTSSNSYTSGTITIDGSSYSLIGYQEFKNEVCIYEDTIRVYHNADGTKSFTISLSCKGQANTSLSGVTLSGSGTAKMDTIPRTSTFAATDAAIGSVSTITITREASTLYHRIKVQFGTLTGYVTNSGGFSSSASTITGTSVGFTIPNDFYYEIPNGTKGTCTLTLYTLSNGTVVGDAVTKTIQITTIPSRCNPTLTITMTHDNADTVALTGSNTAYIRGYSDAKCFVAATGRFGATIKSVWADAEYTKNDDGTYTINQVESDTITFYAKDSRGYTGSTSVSITLVPYIVLTNNSVGGRPNPTDGSAFLQIKGDYFADSFGAVDNTLEISYSIVYPDGTESATKTVTPTIEDNSYSARIDFTGFDYTKVYYAHVTVKDKLLEVYKYVTIKQGIPVFDWGKSDFQFHVPVDMDGNRLQGLGAPVDPEDALRLCDVPNPYPVGSVYISTVSTSPAQLFGGSWEQLQNRFLLGAGSSYSAGSTGGAATHTLTIDEMPRHRHWGSARFDYDISSGSHPSAIVDGVNQNNLYSNYAGGGNAHNNMPPYLVVYMWKRVA